MLDKLVRRAQKYILWSKRMRQTLVFETGEDTKNHDNIPQVLRGAIDKKTVNAILRAAGIPVPEDVCFVNSELVATDLITSRTFTLEQFPDSLRKQALFVKPVFGGQGIGIFQINGDDWNNGQAFARIAECVRCDTKGEALIQKVIIQHPALASLHPCSTNSLRIVTRRSRASAEVAIAILKMGRGGSIVDNSYAGGLFAGVSLESGVVNTPLLDKDFNEYSQHPDTGVELTGFQIPHWPDVIHTLCRAHLVFKLPETLGWDVAITDSGPVIIETNVRWGIIKNRYTDPRFVSRASGWDSLGYLQRARAFIGGELRKKRNQLHGLMGLRDKRE
jgi:hypothetical protein